MVVDEAGMLDQDTAVALLRIAEDAGAGIALVGDRAQLPAVGRGGVLDLAAQVCPRTVDMATVRRFVDPQYADLTVRMRRGDDPSALFGRLLDQGLVAIHPDVEDAQRAIALAARHGVALTVATNDEARALNAVIRESRVQRGAVDDSRTAYGSDGLAIGGGDVIQTRQNRSELGVANRQTWEVQRVSAAGEVWARELHTAQPGRTVRLPAAYVAEHTHLAYTATAYGVQGATATRAHTVLGDALDSSSLYVGMTRGREQNTLHVVAADLDDAREQFVTAMQRDRADRGLTAATRAARGAVSGLAPDGPTAFVNAERARLRELIRTAEPEVVRWETAAAALARLGGRYSADFDRQSRILASAKDAVPLVRAEVSVPLAARAAQDAADLKGAHERMRDAHAALRDSGRFGRRAAARTASEAEVAWRATEDGVRRRWGSVPSPWGDVQAWATHVAEQRAEADPRVIGAWQNETAAAEKLHGIVSRYSESKAELCHSLGGDQHPATIADRASASRSALDTASRSLAEIEALPVHEAAGLIRDRAAQDAAEKAAEAARRAQAAERARHHAMDPVYHPGPDRSFGPSL